MVTVKTDFQHGLAINVLWKPILLHIFAKKNEQINVHVVYFLWYVIWSVILYHPYPKPKGDKTKTKFNCSLAE